eukprot:SAG11_NODE_29363_length_311_cov_1.462264_1_plen_61_part_10
MPTDSYFWFLAHFHRNRATVPLRSVIARSVHVLAIVGAEVGATCIRPPPAVALGKWWLVAA